MPRRRRRRPDSGENLEGLEDEQDDLEIRVISLEEELRTLRLSAATAAQDTLALRARLEGLAREFEEGPVDDYEEFDEFERKLGTVQDELGAARQRLEEMGARLETAGAADELSAAVEKRLRAVLDERVQELGGHIESRLAPLESAGDSPSGAGLEELGKRTEGMLNVLRDEFGELVSRVRGDFSREVSEALDAVEARLAEKVSPVILEAKLEALADDIQDKVGVDLNAVRMHLESSIKALNDQVGALGDTQGRAGQDELDELKQAFEDLKGSVADAGGLGQKARVALESVNALETQVREQESVFQDIAERAEEYAGLAEEHLDRVNLAVRLVDTLEDKIRTALGSADTVLDELNLSEEETAELGFELDDLLQVMIKHQATDLHVKVGAPPYVRLDGELIPVGNHVLGPDACKRLVYSSLPLGKRRQLLRDKDVNYRYETPGAKFEATAFLERGYASAVFRMVPSEVPGLEDLYLPTILKKLATMNGGLVLISGPAGSGKSTTLASVVDYINVKRKVHVLTIEDPIEFYHQDRTSIVTQREIGPDVDTFASALRRANRQDPDVLVLSALPDAESTWGAITAADNGVLVFAALPAENCVGALDRMLGFFPEQEQRQVRKRLATCLRGIVSQALLSRTDQKGRVPATEVVLVNQTIAAVVAEGDLYQLPYYIEQGEGEGMMTFQHSLGRLYDAGLISQDEAAGREAPPPAASPPPPLAQPRASSPPPPPITEPPVAAAPPPAAAPPRHQHPPLAASGAPPEPAGQEPLQEDTLMNWL